MIYQLNQFLFLYFIDKEGTSCKWSTGFFVVKAVTICLPNL